MKSWKKRILAAFAAACLSVTALPAAALAAGEEGERGVLTYTEAIAPQYDNAGQFSDGLAPVEKNGKWGYIDENNKVVIPFRYDIAGLFSEGYAIVGAKVDTYPEVEYDWVTGEGTETGRMYTTYEMAFVDTKGNETQFLYNGYYDEETGNLTTGPIRYSTTDETLSPAVAFHNGYISFYDPDEAGAYLFDTTGRAVDLPLADDSVSWYDPYGWQVTENTLIVGIFAAAGGDQKYLNLKTGQTLTVPVESSETAYVYTDLRPFNQGMAWVGVRSESIATGEVTSRWGVIDATGKFIIQPAYADFRVSDVYGDYEVFGVTGLAMVENPNGKWGAINKSGQTVIPFQYDYLYSYNFGLAAFEQNGKWGFLDENGSVAIPAQYAQTTGFGDDGYAVVYDGSKAYVIDSKGSAVPGADKLDPDTYFQEVEGGDTPVVYAPSEYVVIQENGKYGFGHISYQPALPEKSDMSGWAYEEVTAAIEENLVPTYLQNLYHNAINRGEFCDLTIQAVSETMGKDIDVIVKEKTGKTLEQWQQEYPFYDATDSDVIAAYALGIVNGRGEGKFDPYASITRQEAAAFLARAAKVLGMDTTQAEAIQFNDGSAISSIFQDAVNFVCGINVMNGTGSNNFSPRGNYTREQSYMTIYRLFQAVAAE